MIIFDAGSQSFLRADFTSTLWVTSFSSGSGSQSFLRPVFTTTLFTNFNIGLGSQLFLRAVFTAKLLLWIYILAKVYNHSIEQMLHENLSCRF